MRASSWGTCLLAAIATQMDLYSASGNKCGSVKFPSGGLTTGADGSVIGSSGDRGCTKTVWPGLLR
jgi:hypothetical protein